MRRFFQHGVLSVGLTVTVCLNLFTLHDVVRARTSNLWQDQWVVVQDLMRHEGGESLCGIVWPPFWGHRLVVPRLLFFADARWLSLTSLSWLTIILQLLHISLLVVLARLLLRRRSSALFLVGITLILNLMLSPFQMENFVWGMQTMFILVFVSATGAFLTLSSGEGGLAFWLCTLLATLSSLTMPNGILVWPSLVFQSVYLKRSRRDTILIGLFGSALILFYLWRYARPLDMGMGALGILRHPLSAVGLLGLIIGSPFRFTITADVIVGVLVLAVTGYAFVRALLLQNERRWPAALASLMIFLALSALSLVAGRLTPNDLNFSGKDLLPGRYFTLICLFWTAVGLLVLSIQGPRRIRVLLLSFFGILFILLMFVSIPLQRVESEDWSDFFRGTDALACALIMDAPDEKMLSLLCRPRRSAMSALGSYGNDI